MSSEKHPFLCEACPGDPNSSSNQDEDGGGRHQRRTMPFMPGDVDSGGLGTRMPVLGLTIGMAFRVRSADGWCSFIGDDVPA